MANEITAAQAQAAASQAAATTPETVEANALAAEIAAQSGAEPAEPAAETAEPAAPAEKTFTQSQVNELIQQRITRERKRLEAEQAEAVKLAGMNETEKLNHANAKLAAELEELRTAQTLSELKTVASATLAEKGISATPELLATLVTTDAETTNANLTAFAGLVESQSQALLTAKLKGAPQKVVTSPVTTGSTITKAEINAIKDPAERQRQIAAHIDLYS